jgi:hypothetical protein
MKLKFNVMREMKKKVKFDGLFTKEKADKKLLKYSLINYQ